MRTIVNISLPQELHNVVIRSVDTGRFASKSEFFRHLIRLWMERDLIKDLRESDREFRLGKGTLLTSLKDLR